jgi:hypothetical protein
MSVCLSCGSRAACCCGPSFALPAFCGTGFRRMLIKVKTGGTLHSCLRYDRNVPLQVRQTLSFYRVGTWSLVACLCSCPLPHYSVDLTKPSTHSPIPESCALTVFTNQRKSNVKVVPGRALETGTGTGVEFHCIRWRSVVSFMLRPMYPRGKGCRCPLSWGGDGILEKVWKFCKKSLCLL